MFAHLSVCAHASASRVLAQVAHKETCVSSNLVTEGPDMRLAEVRACEAWRTTGVEHAQGTAGAFPVANAPEKWDAAGRSHSVMHAVRWENGWAEGGSPHSSIACGTRTRTAISLRCRYRWHTREGCMGASPAAHAARDR